MAPKFHGIVPPVVTPFVEGKSGVLDEDAFARIIERMVVAGISGVFVLGTNGEQQSLGMPQRRRVLEAASRIVRQRVPMYVGVSDNSYEDIQQNINAATDTGADCVVVHPPSYFNLSASEMSAFFRETAEMSPVPVMLYNTALAGQLIPCDVVCELSKVDNIAGIKDSSSDMMYLYRVLERRVAGKPFSVFCGNDVLIADALRNGADGGVPGGCNILPEITCGLYRAHLDGDIARFDAIRDIIRRYDPLFWADGSPSSFLKATKYALSALGLCSETCLPPIGKIADTARDVIQHRVEEAQASCAALQGGTGDGDPVK